MLVAFFNIKVLTYSIGSNFTFLLIKLLELASKEQKSGLNMFLCLRSCTLQKFCRVQVAWVSLLEVTQMLNDLYVLDFQEELMYYPKIHAILIFPLSQRCNSLHCINMPVRQHPAGMQNNLFFSLFLRLELIPALDTDRIYFGD